MIWWECCFLMLKIEDMLVFLYYFWLFVKFVMRNFEEFCYWMNWGDIVVGMGGWVGNGWCGRVFV